MEAVIWLLSITAIVVSIANIVLIMMWSRVRRSMRKERDEQD